MVEFNDRDLVFHLEVYKGYFDITRWCLGRIRSCYPGSRIVVVSDGDPDSRYAEYLEHGIELVYGDHLSLPEMSGELWQRRFANYLSSPGKYLFRVDSDAGFYRRFSSLPATKCLFGTPCCDFIQGGMMGLTTDAVVEIMDSDLLKAPWMRECNHDANGIRMPSDDLAIGRVAQSLGIPLVKHPEFHCTWTQRVNNPNLQFAVIHPCKNATL